ncbi:MAG: alpha/beta hydrolase [Proteobacteria bacterium]|nr:alpha/beta hydrolase [Pseudomonadota bacterium]
MTATNSYMITNRQSAGSSGTTDVVPLSGSRIDDLYWYMAGGAFNTTPGAYITQSSNPSTTAPPSFQSAIVDQLNAQTTSPRLVVYIHGLGNNWDDAIKSSQYFAKYLATSPSFGGGYPGLLVGFSWPSYEPFTSELNYATSWPPELTSGSIRDNINGSIESFGSLISWMQDIRIAVPGLTISLMCHSEGNYMAMLGMAALSSVSIDQVILLAADINNGALQIPPDATNTLIGNGAKMAALSSRVTVYFSHSDNTLALSEGSYGGIVSELTSADWHNPSYQGRLGQCGPSYNQGYQFDNVVGLDCSAVVNYTNLNSLDLPFNPVDSEPVSLHSSYRFIPQILADISQTLQDLPASTVDNRTPTANTNPQGYFMDPT